MILVYFIKHCLTNFLFIDNISRKKHLALIGRTRNKLLAEGVALTKASLPLDFYRDIEGGKSACEDGVDLTPRLHKCSHISSFYS